MVMEKQTIRSALLCLAVFVLIWCFLWVQYSRRHQAWETRIGKKTAQWTERSAGIQARSKVFFTMREMPRPVSAQNARVGGGGTVQTVQTLFIRTLWWGPGGEPGVFK